MKIDNNMGPVKNAGPFLFDRFTLSELNYSGFT